MFFVCFKYGEIVKEIGLMLFGKFDAVNTILSCLCVTRFVNEQHTLGHFNYWIKFILLQLFLSKPVGRCICSSLHTSI